MTPTAGDDASTPAPSYRMSNEQIARWNRRLVVISVIIGSLAALSALAGVVTYLVGGRTREVLDSVSGPLYAIAGFIVFGGVILVLALGAWVGGQSLARYGGWVGLALTVGILATAIGIASGFPCVAAAGIVLIVLTVVAMFALGIRAGVPIWLQLPIVGSPRWYLTRSHGSAGSRGHTRSFGRVGGGSVTVTIPDDVPRPAGHGRHEASPPTDGA